jgi:hypothetical protein
MSNYPLGVFSGNTTSGITASSITVSKAAPPNYYYTPPHTHVNKFTGNYRPKRGLSPFFFFLLSIDHFSHPHNHGYFARGIPGRDKLSHFQKRSFV